MNLTRCFTALMLMFVALAYSAEEVKITDNSPKTKITTLKKGSERVIKRYKFTEVPEELIGLQTVVADRGNYGNEGMGFEFTVDQPVTVYIFADKRMKGKPEGWEATEMKATWYVNKPYHDLVYKKDFPKGKVIIPSSPKKIIPHAAAVKAK